MEKILINIIVKGFYKKYAKIFFIGFCLFTSYFLFIQIAGVFLNHNRDFWSLFLALQFATEPIFILGFCVLAILYALLAFFYLKSEINSKKLNFLKYTFFTLSLQKRFTHWFIIVGLIFLPLLAYSLFSLIIGILVLGKFTGLWIFLLVIFLGIISILIIDYLRFRPQPDSNHISNLILSLNVKRYPWLINIINLLKTRLLMVIGIKCLSILTLFIIGNYLWVEEHDLNVRIMVFGSLSLSFINIVWLYQDFLFEGSKMRFVLNYPYSRIQRFLNPIPFFFIMMLPEAIFSIFQFGIINFSIILISFLIFLLFIKSILLTIGNRPLMVLKVLSTIYFIIFLLLLYQIIIPVLLIVMLITYLLFVKNYRYEMITEKIEI